MTRRSVIDEAKDRISIEDYAGSLVKLRKAGAELRGPCPICRAGQKSDNPPFAVKPSTGKWVCYGCGEHGDVLDLRCAMSGESFVEAAHWLLGSTFEPAKPVQGEKVHSPSPEGTLKRAAEMWNGSRPIKSTIAETYLRYRGIGDAVIAAASSALRFHPAAKWCWDEDAGRWIKAPAIVCRPVTTAGPTGGVHATYLAKDGVGKAALNPAKRMHGPQLGGDGARGGVWLIGPEGVDLAGTDLIVSEGIETGLSVAQLAMAQGKIVRVAAALSLNSLQGGLLKDADKCVDLSKPKGNPDYPPFTWPEPASAPWGVVRIAVDHDMSDIHQLVRTGRGKPVPVILGAKERARLCADLAVAGWKAAGAAQVRAMAARYGRDFNDEIRGV